MPTEKPRFCITVDDETMKEIDDFRFANRYASRSKAALDLIRMGLDVLRENEKNDRWTVSEIQFNGILARFSALNRLPA